VTANTAGLGLGYNGGKGVPPFAALPAFCRVTATLRRPLPYRNFGTPDQEVRLAWRGIRVFGAVKSAALVEVLARGSPLAEATAAARAWARRTVTAAIGPDDPQGAAIVLAVLIGDRAGLSPDLEARMQRAGTYHVLAISAEHRRAFRHVSRSSAAPAAARVVAWRARPAPAAVGAPGRAPRRPRPSTCRRARPAHTRDQRRRHCRADRRSVAAGRVDVASADDPASIAILSHGAPCARAQRAAAGPDPHARRPGLAAHSPARRLLPRAPSGR
jgi:hypothetical protein